MNRSRIIFAGAGEFGLPTLRAIADAGHQIVQIVSQPDRRSGRGRHVTPTPISKSALDHSLPLIRTDDINRELLPPADVLVVIAFGQKIAEHVVHHARFGAVNLHASILPKFRGAAPIHAAILAGETVTGNSVIRLAKKMDAGPILAQSSLPIGELETTGGLHDRLAADGAPLMLRVLDQLAAGTAAEREQDHSQATLARKLSRESARIDWSRDAQSIANQIRGMHPWPGCHVKLVDRQGAVVDRLTLVRGRATALAAAAGTIGERGVVGAGGGAVEIVELQPEGRNSMSLLAYRNGHRWEAEMRLEST